MENRAFTPTFEDNTVVDDFFIKGRDMWPDLKELTSLKLDRTKVTDKMVDFFRSTALNEHGIVHYTQGYYRSYGQDYKLAAWAAIWGGEEYLHSIVLRCILKGLGESISDEQLSGLEQGRYEENSDAYLTRIRPDGMSRNMQQLIYAVVQEFAAVIAYGSVADACEEPTVEKLLHRIAKDEMRHCRINQLFLEALVKNSKQEEVELIWDQFNIIFKDFKMPQEHIAMFNEQNLGTELYVSYWKPKDRSRMILFLTHYFSKFRTKKVALQSTAPASAGVDIEQNGQITAQ